MLDKWKWLLWGETWKFCSFTKEKIAYQFTAFLTKCMGRTEPVFCWFVPLTAVHFDSCSKIFLSSQPQFQQVPVSKLVKIQRCIHSFTHPFTTIIAITIKLLQSHFPRSICGINTLSGAQWFIHASQKWVSCGRDYSMIDFTLFEWLGCWWWMQKEASVL